MFSSRTTDHLAFVSRQLAGLLPDSTPEAALEKIAAACPREYQRDVETLRRMLDLDDSPEPGFGRSPYRTLALLMSAVPRQKALLLRNFVEYVQQARVLFETYWAGVIGLMWYLGALCIVAIALAVAFSLTVIPSFTSYFSEFGAPLPDATVAVFALGNYAIPVLAIALAILATIVIWSVSLFHGRVQRLEPLPRWPDWMPILGKLAEYYNAGLFMNFARMLRACGVERTRAVSIAATEANLADTLDVEAPVAGSGDYQELQIFTELSIATALGRFDDELEFQCEQHLARLALVLAEARDRFSLLLKIVLYIFVATLVVAMYLPIFRMGSVI